MSKLSSLLFCLICTLSSYIFADSELVTPTMANSYPVRESLAQFYGAIPISFTQLTEDINNDIDILVWACHSRQLPPESNNPKVIACLRQFIEKGGHLFLVSFAQSYVVDLGLETVAPDRMDFFRYGYNDSSQFGGYFTIGIKGDASHPLFQHLACSEIDENAFLISGSSHINLENCFWTRNPLQQGQSLGNYFRINEKGQVLDQKQVQVLNLWTLGQGKVLGYGNNVLLEDFWFSRDQENLKTFLGNVACFLSDKKNPRIGALPETPSRLHADTYMSPPAFPEVQPHTLHRKLPGLPYIGHWGWHAQIQYQRADRQCVDLTYFKEKMIDEPFRWGANLLEFYAPGMGRNEGYPFIWEDDDPMTKPGEGLSYWGGQWIPGWNNDTVRELFKTAHARDMLVQLFYHPNPVRIPGGTESARETEAYQKFCRFQAREFQNPLLYGWQASHDGVGSEWWGDGQHGEYISQLWLYNPGSYRYSTALLPGSGPYFHGTWMCAFGRTGNINACGFGDQWRYVFHPPLYLSYQADCRSMKPSTGQWGGWANFGGGSTPDWILRQMYDFARDRLYLDSGIWWLGEPAATMKESDRQYVYGCSADPLRCAVTTTLRATGADGYRAKAYQTVSNLPQQYLCDEPFPQDTALIQNNYFRLLRMAGEDKGILQYDPTRLANFQKTGRPIPAEILSDNFFTAMPVDIAIPNKNPDRIAFKIGEVDGSCNEFRVAGGYHRQYECSADTDQFPAQIRYESEPDWPHEIQINFTADIGRYDLQIYTLPNDYTSTMEVEIDGRPAGVYFPGHGDTGKHILPVSLDSARQHQLLFRVQKANTSKQRSDGQAGLAHAFDAVILSRTGQESVIHHFNQPIGHQAVLEEVVYKDPTGAIRQSRTYTVDSDSPVLKMAITNHSLEPTRWLTRMRLPDHDRLIPFPGQTAALWKLQPRQPSIPPLLLIDYSKHPLSIIKEGDDVLIASEKAIESTMNLGLLIDDGLYDEMDYGSIAQMLNANETTLWIGEQAITRVNSLGIPRVEVVRIRNPLGGPYLVAEENQEGETFWLARGAQLTGDMDRLKLYLQPRGKARIQRYGYINNIVKPGYGCQYSLAIRDNIQSGKCEVEVVKTGPFMFAPRIDWKQPFDTVKVNGEDWCYFDDHLVYLPNKPGRYTVEVLETGRKYPSLGRTFLSVESALWNETEMTLELNTTHPHWWEGPLPGNIPYTALVFGNEYRPMMIEGDGSLIDWSHYEVRDNDLVKMQDNGAILQLNPGMLKIYFQRKQD